MKAIKSNRHDTCSVKKLFMQRQQLSGGITQYFHVLNDRQGFVGVTVDIIME